jgi:hypothetical protein
MLLIDMHYYYGWMLLKKHLSGLCIGHKPDRWLANLRYVTPTIVVSNHQLPMVCSGCCIAAEQAEIVCQAVIDEALGVGQIETVPIEI